MTLRKSNDSSKLYYHCCGNGETILFIHGLLCDSIFFEKTAKLLSNEYKTVVYDRRGYSRSQVDTDAESALRNHVEDAIAILDAVKSKKCYVVASSFGCIIATELAKKYPERISGMLLHEPAFITLLPDTSESKKAYLSICNYIKSEKLNSAVTILAQLIGAADNRGCQPIEDLYIAAEKNKKVSFTIDFPLSINYKVNVQTGFLPPYIIGVGELSRNTMREEIVRAAAEEEKTVLFRFPGGHNAAYELPHEFAAAIIGIIHLFGKEAMPH